MPETLVLDASAAIAIAHQEPTCAVVLANLRRHVAGGGEIAVPGHFWLEIANVLTRRYGFHPRRVAEVVRTIDELGPQTVEIDRPVWLLTLDRMHRFGLAAYDAVYLALADVTNGSLLTLDRALAAAAGIRAVRLGADRLAESGEVYRSESPDAVWADFGRYLAELREEAAAG
jgi:predicted nucleic acid-binding protein